MKNNNIAIAVSILLSCLLSACGGGGGSSSPDLSTDACSSIGLYPRVIDGTSCGGLQQSPVVRVITSFEDGSAATCTGTMISDRKVLTAIHCFVKASDLSVYPNAIGIVAGEAGSHQTIVATNFYISPLFRLERIAGEVQFFNDFVIMELAHSPGLPTLPILASRSLNAGDTVKIYGYGRTTPGTSELPNDNLVDLFSGETSVRSVTNNHIRTLFSGGSGTCFGDSGGPLIAMVNGQPAIAGILSQFVEKNGQPGDCSQGSVSQYTNLQSTELLGAILASVPEAQVL